VKALRLRFHLSIQPSHPGLMRIKARHERGPRGAASRGIVELREAHAVRRKPVQVWRRDLASITTEIRKPHVIDQDHDHVGTSRGLGGSEQEETRDEDVCGMDQWFEVVGFRLLAGRVGDSDARRRKCAWRIKRATGPGQRMAVSRRSGSLLRCAGTSGRITSMASLPRSFPVFTIT